MWLLSRKLQWTFWLKKNVANVTVSRCTGLPSLPDAWMPFYLHWIEFFPLWNSRAETWIRTSVNTVVSRKWICILKNMWCTLIHAVLPQTQCRKTTDCLGTRSKRMRFSSWSSSSITAASGYICSMSKWNWTPAGGSRKKFLLSYNQSAHS